MQGKYTVAEVEQRSGVPASSLRQWERRYGLPKPQRAGSGYRLYGEDDLKQIEAMRGFIADGVPASRAAELVKELARASVGPRPVIDLSSELVDALVTLDEARASGVLGEAFALHTMEDVLLDVITPAMVTVGERWHAGEILVTTEHFATNYIQGRLRALLALMPGSVSARRVVVTCAPAERHELGALVLAVLLRRAGLDAIYLGADTPLADLMEMMRALRPDALFLSALRADVVAELKLNRAQLRQLEPLFVVGGQAFEDSPAAARELGAVYLGNDVRKVIPAVVALLEARAETRS